MSAYLCRWEIFLYSRILVNINSLKLIHDIFLNNHNNDDDDHHMEKTKAGLKGLYIREITLKYRLYTSE